MENEKKMEKESRSVWPYLISGVAIGSALGVLFAPETGKETRRKVADWLKEKRAQGKRWTMARKHGRTAEEKETVAL